MNEVEEVKNKIDIVELIGGYLSLKKAGVNYKALCPFHTEKTPSFMVSPERQSFRCFGCNKGGDIYTFIEEIEGMEFFDALKLLAGKAGVELKKRQNFSYGEKEIKPTEKTRLFEINDLAAKLYHKILLDHPKAEGARNYLKKRGVKKETIINWNLGYAPKMWDLLSKFLGKKGYSEKEIFKAGLLVLGESGKYWDRFRGRIMFPICNISGQVIAFTGRVLDDSDLPAGRQVQKAAKYVNSSESPIYTKGKTIYGLDRARLDIRAQNRSVLVEGNIDVIACHTAGFKNVVAVSGTALTSEQLKILARYSPEVILIFDSDNAGIVAMKRAISLALQNDLSPKVTTFLGFKDPDEAIKADPKNFERAIKDAKPALTYWIDSLILENDILAPDGRKKISREILPVLKIISDEIEKDYYIKYLAKKLSVSESVVKEQIKKTKSQIGDQNYASNSEVKKSQNQIENSSERIFQKIAGIVWQSPELVSILPKEIFSENFSDKMLSDFFAYIKEKKEKNLLSSELRAKLDSWSLLATADLEQSEEQILKKELQSLVKTYLEGKKEAIKSEYAQKIAEAESSGDREKLKSLLKEFQNAIINNELK
ncbi:MAG: DNA primase [Candidatus Berkelbacteria bacterium Athens1014_28]|uniref:DNA primase n=1 Tax=Candidatus Berkelbacteria bacterium Athens1014_28 TaxID=2017145 RepID=A0A554LNC4_9BACT|nr:MAG: DNA primase [Candidatus Berkelbacteria bacterium Athens1014_28]